MSYQRGAKLSEQKAAKWHGKLAPHLLRGEAVWALAKASSLKPMVNAVAITNARVLAFQTMDTPAKPPKVAILAHQLSHVDSATRMGSTSLVIALHDGETVKFGVDAADVPFLQHYINHLKGAGVAAEVQSDLAEKQRVAAEDAAVNADREDRKSQVTVVGSQPTAAVWRAIDGHSGPGELPWLIIHPGSGRGALAAFEDRCVLAKVGAMTSFMAGSLGAGRVTVFPFTDITNIEYNGGLMNGVLEILTPSYQGTANHDYWSGTFKPRNKASQDPWTLFNALPLDRFVYKDAQLHINALLRKIADAKRPQVTVHTAPAPATPTAGATGLAEELRGLADLHRQGVLDDAEFAAAKQATIARHSG